MLLPRRSLLAGLGLTLAAPAIVRTPGLLMPVRQERMPDWRISYEHMPDLERVWASHNNHNSVFDLMQINWMSREELLKRYPMTQEV